MTDHPAAIAERERIVAMLDEQITRGETRTFELQQGSRAERDVAAGTVALIRARALIIGGYHITQSGE